MLCIDCSRQLKECVRKGLLNEEHLAKIIDELSNSPHSTSFHAIQSSNQEAKKAFNPIMVLYYIGALLILSAFGWFLGSQWDALGPGGILVVSIVYALLFAYLGKVICFREKYPVAGGLLFTCAVGMVPLIVYSLEALTGIWPKANPVDYHGYYVWINGSWIIIELATIGVAFATLKKVKFSFLVMPAAIAFWFLSMDLAEIVISTQQLTWEMRSWVSVVVGLLILLLGYGVDRISKGVDYAFWIYLSGLLSFWGGMATLQSKNESGHFIFCLVNLALITVSLKLQRKSFAVFGALGLFGYIGHLAWTVFKESALFPIALVFIGVMMILSTVLYQKNYSKLQIAFGTKK